MTEDETGVEMSYNPTSKLVQIYPYNLFLNILNYNGRDNDSGLDILYHLYPPALLKAVSGLDDRENEVIQMRYLEKMTLEQVGRQYGVTRERIRQVEAHAIRKLRHPSLIRTYKYDFIPERSMEMFEESCSNAISILEKFQKNAIKFQYEISESDVEPDVIDRIDDLSVSIDELDLTCRVRNLLLRAGVRSIRDLTMMTSKDVTDLRNAGKFALNEIRNKLHERGMKLADEVNDEE